MVIFVAKKPGFPMLQVVGYDGTGAGCKVYGYVENDGDDDDDDDDDGKKVAPAA
jgi:hypothetical protein